MARPVNIREESAISTFRLGLSFGASSAVLCVAIVLEKLERGRDMVRQMRFTENTRRFIQYRARTDWRLSVVREAYPRSEGYGGRGNDRM